MTESKFKSINAVESLTVEFKTSLFYLAGTSLPSEEQIDVITRTIASFMNQDGGTLYLGVNDEGYATNSVLDEFCLMNAFPAFSGNTYHATSDGYKRFLLDWVSKKLGQFATTLLSIEFQDMGEVVVCAVKAKKSRIPV